jgi:hypothetical protein
MLLIPPMLTEAVLMLAFAGLEGGLLGCEEGTWGEFLEGRVVLKSWFIEGGCRVLFSALES